MDEEGGCVGGWDGIGDTGWVAGLEEVGSAPRFKRLPAPAPVVVEARFPEAKLAVSGLEMSLGGPPTDVREILSTSTAPVIKEICCSNCIQKLEIYQALLW